MLARVGAHGAWHRRCDDDQRDLAEATGLDLGVLGVRSFDSQVRLCLSTRSDAVPVLLLGGLAAVTIVRKSGVATRTPLMERAIRMQDGDWELRWA